MCTDLTPTIEEQMNNDLSCFEYNVCFCVLQYETWGVQHTHTHFIYIVVYLIRSDKAVYAISAANVTWKQSRLPGMRPRVRQKS